MALHMFNLEVYFKTLCNVSNIADLVLKPVVFVVIVSEIIVSQKLRIPLRNRG